jgi:hypothetical protein
MFDGYSSVRVCVEWSAFETRGEADISSAIIRVMLVVLRFVGYSERALDDQYKSGPKQTCAVDRLERKERLNVILGLHEAVGLVK